jgi:hypothetical protein
MTEIMDIWILIVCLTTVFTGLGIVDFNGYQRICVHFLKDPEAIQKAKTEEFSFQNLIRKDSETSDSNSDLSSSE